MSLALLKIEAIIEEFRKLDSEIASHCMCALIHVARQEEAGSYATVKDVGLHLGVSSAAASRNIAMLSDLNRHKKQGYALVETWENPDYRIEKFIKLTAKGKRVIKSIEELMNGYKPEG